MVWVDNMLTTAHYHTEFVSCGFDCELWFCILRFSNACGSKNALSSSSDAFERAIASRNFFRAISRNFSKLSTWLFSLSANLSICSSVNGDVVDDGGGGGGDDVGGSVGVTLSSSVVTAAVVAAGVVWTMLISVVVWPSVFFSPLLDAVRLSARWPCESDGTFELAGDAFVRTSVEPKFGSDIYGGPGDIKRSIGTALGRAAEFDLRLP